MNVRITTVFIAASLCASASAQTQWFMEFDRPWVTPANPTVTIRLSAGFPTQYWAIAGVLVNLHATEPGWSNATVLLPPPFNLGVINGPSITGITAGQVHFPPVIYANPANPLAMYEVQWTAMDFTHRTIEFRTQTVRYDVYHASGGGRNLVGQLTEGHGLIRIVPAPGVASTMALMAVVAPRPPRGHSSQESQ